MRTGLVFACVWLVWTASAPSLPLLTSDFEDGVAAWSLHRQDGAEAAVRTESGAAKITIAKSGQPHHIQFARSFDSSPLHRGDVYRLRFRTRSDVAQSFPVQIIGAARPWGNLGLRRTVSVAPAWKTHGLVFRAAPPSQPKAKIDFFLGETKGVVWIDDVILEPCDLQELPPPKGPSLSAGSAVLTFTEDGAVGRLVHRDSGQVLVGGLEQPSAYELVLREDGRERTVASTEGRLKRSAGTRDHRAFTFEHPGIEVCCTVDCGSDGLARFEISVTNRTDAAVTAIRYPILHCPARLGDDSSDDAILYPRCDGALIENPLEAMGRGGLADTYPGPLSCQVMAYYGGTAGLYVGTHDAQGCVKRFNCAMGADLELSITHLLPALPGRGVRVPYPVVVGVFTGDWYDAADIYRRWSRAQAWCAKTLLERDDTPSWVRKGGLVTLYDPRARKDGKQRFDPKGLRDFLAMLSDLSGVPVIPNNRGWERYGQWCGQEYLPPVPDEEALRNDTTLIRESGGHGMIMLSGYRWTIEKPQPDGSVYSSAERYEREVEPQTTYLADGREPYVGTSPKKNDWHGTKWAMMCPGTEFAKKTIVDVAAECVRSGYSIVHFDQVVSGPAASCFCGSREHGHPPGYGPWMYQAMANLFARIRAACEPLDPDFALSMEEPNELFLPRLNLCQSRPNGLTTEFPMHPPMTRVVSLFSYLYHDYLVGWIAFYPWRSGGHAEYSLARGASAGMMPGLHWESLQKWPVPERERFETLLRNCCRVYAKDGGAFLMFGKMHKPLALDVPVRSLKLQPGGRVVKVPAVSNSVWESADGRRAVILINPETTDHSVHVPGVPTPVRVPSLDAVVVALNGEEHDANK